MKIGRTFFRRLFWRWPRLLTLVAFLVVAADSEAAVGQTEGRRVALVVGNSEYRSVPALKNASRDAREIAKTLTSLGFEVIDRMDVTRAEFDVALRDFYASTGDAEAAVIYYSGHGFQMNGVNYLVPVDATLRDRTKIEEETVRLDEVAARAQSGDRQTLIFLDACRNNPLPQAVRDTIAGEGLAQLETGSGTFIAFATQPGNISRDGQGNHSPFTSALLEHIPTPGISISDMMIRVRNSVEVATLHEQTPWDQSSLRSQFYFNPEDEADAGGELTDEDREMLLALDPVMRRKFEAKFGIKIDERDLPAEDEPVQTAAFQPMLRIESAEEEGVSADSFVDAQPPVDDGAIGDGETAQTESIVSEAADATDGETSVVEEEPVEETFAPEPDALMASAENEEPIVGLTQILPGSSFDEAASESASPAEDNFAGSASAVLAEAEAIGVVASAVRTSDGTVLGRVASYDPVTKATVSNGLVLRQPSSTDSVAAERATPSARIAASGNAERLSPASRASAPTVAGGETTYQVAALSSGERSVSVGTVPSVNLAPVRSDFSRVVGEEVIDSSGGAAAAALPSIGAETAPGAAPEQGADGRLAALDPSSIDTLSKGPPDKPDGAPPTATDAPAADIPADIAPADLPAAIQTELARLGCYRSGIDGDWGSGSQRALLRYYVARKADPDLLDPNAALFARLKTEETVVCTRTETEPDVQPKQRQRPAVAATPPRANEQRQQQAARPSRQPQEKARAARPEVPKAPRRTIATAPAKAPVKQQASAAAPKKSLKKSLTMGAFR
ncbi:MAG: caspase family protein [Rhizobiaceae bacterium]|nr:caspase family protein [Rhizobiaceae bacterium]